MYINRYQYDTYNIYTHTYIYISKCIYIYLHTHSHIYPRFLLPQQTQMALFYEKKPKSKQRTTCFWPTTKHLNLQTPSHLHLKVTWAMLGGYITSRSRREDKIGKIKTTKSEFASLGPDAWWMHETCMTPEDGGMRGWGLGNGIFCWKGLDL